MAFRSFEDFLGAIPEADNQKLEEFRQDLFALLGVQETPEMMDMYGYAWRSAHAGGLEEVAVHFRDLVKSFQEAKIL